MAREYWPSDLSTWDASEGYGWGATTASYVIRQLCGFYESEDTSGIAFRLAPAFPPELIASRTLGLGPLPYRGRLLWLTYHDAGGGELDLELRVDQAMPVLARDEASGQVVHEAPASPTHCFRLRLGQAVSVTL